MVEFLNPVSQELLDLLETMPNHCLGRSIEIYAEKNVLPNLEKASFALLGVLDNRKEADADPEEVDLFHVRKELYGLFKGNWEKQLVDLGDIPAGHNTSDTRYALTVIVRELLKLNIIPIILGGTQDLVYAQYRAYDGVKKMVSLVNVDSCFDIGDAELEMTHKSYVGKIVFDEPFNLFNYSVVGYQSYLNSPDEIALMDKLFFDAYRLGEICSDISGVEPIFRNCDLVTFDMAAVKAGESGSRIHHNPNGFDGREICALARYAGISNSVSSFSAFELGDKMNVQNAMLIAQMIWYFIEGVNFRIEDEDFNNKEYYTTYVVPQEDVDLIFIRSIKSNRWWMEIPFLNTTDNKNIKQALLPCTESDYLDACNQELPGRWVKACLKNGINF